MTEIERGTLPSAARLEMFSDGVLAIAITLLILEIDVPTAGKRGSGMRWEASGRRMSLTR